MYTGSAGSKFTFTSVDTGRSHCFLFYLTPTLYFHTAFTPRTNTQTHTAPNFPVRSVDLETDRFSFSVTGTSTQHFKLYFIPHEQWRHIHYCRAAALLEILRKIRYLIKGFLRSPRKLSFRYFV
jgi:hypothetical protein